MFEKIDINQIIYESFLSVRTTEEQLRRNREYGRVLDKFYDTLTEEQQKLFERFLDLLYDEEYLIEQKLIQYVLEFVRAII